MAFGRYCDSFWVNVWNNNYYAIDVLMSYAQDENTYKTRIWLEQIRCRGLNSSYSLSFTNAYMGLAINTTSLSTFNYSGAQTTISTSNTFTYDNPNYTIDIDGLEPNFTIYFKFYTSGGSNYNAPYITTYASSVKSNIIVQLEHEYSVTNKLYEKVNDTWKESKYVYAKVNENWMPMKRIYKNVNGNWTLIQFDGN